MFGWLYWQYGLYAAVVGHLIMSHVVVSEGVCRKWPPCASLSETDHKNANFGQLPEKMPMVRVKIFKKALSGEFLPGHFEDFQLNSLSELAGQIERYIQFAVGCNIRENV